MVSKRSDNAYIKPRRPPGTTPEMRESQLVAAAVDLAEQQILNGTASAQVISYYIKLGSSRERLEQERLKHENELLKVKARAIDQAEEQQKVYEEALRAMRSYQGEPMPEEEEEY